MATGLIALLDDVAAIAKVAAASLDDVIAQSAKAGVKAAGVVIDDAAVTPRYVTGFAAERELPIVAKIAFGSLRNKLLILLPAALGLSWFAPWAIMPLLMLGGVYLCYEGCEKVLEAFAPSHAQPDSHTQADSCAASCAKNAGAEHVDTTRANIENANIANATMEDAKVSGAIKTDFILSAEIMAIALASLPDTTFWTKAIALAAVGVFITLGVYGAVAIIVKADDIGVALARRARTAPVRAFGRTIVGIMPGLLQILSVVGTAAMIWVGGGIVSHGAEHFGAGKIQHAIDGFAAWAYTAAPTAKPAIGWAAGAFGAGLVGLAVGMAAIAATHLFSGARKRVRRG